MTGQRRRIPWVVALTVAFLVPGMVPAGAHTHPTPIERAAPGVVYVEARAEVEVALVEHRQADPAGVHIAIIQSTSNPVLASASGFVVDPTGTVVTSGAITQNDLDRAKIYAVNEAFRRQYGDATLPGDLFTRQQIGAATDLLEQRLEACYPPNRTNDAGGCVVTARPTYVVYPYVTSQEEYGQLDAELLPASTHDVAVLRVRGATSMPTVALGESREGAKAISVLGFTGIPSGPDALRPLDAHLDKVGGSALKTADLNDEEAAENVALAGALTAGMRGGPVVAEKGQVVGFLAPEADSGPPPAAPGRLVDATAIHEVLTAQGITPRRGPVDQSFEAAMHAFKNGGFAAAIPSFKAALALFPGHAIAANDLAVAEQNVASGSPGAAPPATGDPAARSATGSGLPWAVVLLVVAAALVLAAVATLFLRRRRQASATGGVSPSPGTPRPRAGQTAAPSRPATGGPERQAVPSAATGPGSGSAPGGVAVIEGGGSGRGGSASPGRAGPAPSGSALSKSVPGQGRAAPVGEGPRQSSRAPVGEGSRQSSRAPVGEGSRQSSRAPVGEGSRQASRASAAPAPASHRDAAHGPAREDQPAFCTSCGAHLAPHHRYCGRCGVAAW
jgi:hypothetical protein